MYQSSFKHLFKKQYLNVEGVLTICIDPIIELGVLIASRFNIAGYGPSTPYGPQTILGVIPEYKVMSKLGVAPTYKQNFPLYTEG